ncbi:MAG: Cys-tRNA(Pro) deacylase [Firmicutes bacterium]|nr:Cys-tRNA(Pro) deacylase [Bacillota bacterium]MCM1400672.1 Cys-tRNA(Pro) deacylase [Bacteroides sp.]MCM1476366.1 Cys-tRNA(Pro) deacylase [Bacteroides sp.]
MSSSAKIQKTNAARLLDKAKIRYRLVPYEVDENNLAADHVASSLGEDINRVFKTIVLRGERTGHFVCVVPGNCEIDLKKAAKAAGDKKADLIAMKELLPLTGYIRGGCSPIGMKKPFPTFFHATATDFPVIYVSAGMRGLQFEIAPKDLIDYVGATVADIAVRTDAKEEHDK